MGPSVVVILRQQYVFSFRTARKAMLRLIDDERDRHPTSGRGTLLEGAIYLDRGTKRTHTYHGVIFSTGTVIASKADHRERSELIRW